jgi:pimeloyl-ACP methyl ester carboxylesterase
MTEITAHHGLFRSTKLHVDDTGGPGRPVVLIHGWPLSGESWSEQVAALQSAGYRVITYDRRGFGRSDKPSKGYDYDTLTEDLHAVMEGLELSDATIVGFSMGGGEVARYFNKHGGDRLHSAVFAAAVPPYLLQGPDNPAGPLTQQQAQEWTEAIEHDESAFFDEFITQFFSAGDELTVSEAQRAQARALCDQADKGAVLGCMESFGTTDFRGDLASASVPVLVIHGDSDGTVPFEGSGKLTHDAIQGSELHVIAGGPHGCNVSHADEFNRALIAFLAR